MKPRSAVLRRNCNRAGLISYAHEVDSSLSQSECTLVREVTEVGGKAQAFPTRSEIAAPQSHVPVLNALLPEWVRWKIACRQPRERSNPPSQQAATCKQLQPRVPKQEWRNCQKHAFMTPGRHRSRRQDESLQYLELSSTFCSPYWSWIRCYIALRLRRECLLGLTGRPSQR
jgi:hypothetical protein